MTFRNQRGFTFIELLIVVLIMSLLFGFGYTNYRDFARRKATENVVSQIVGELRYTQQAANSVKKPTGECVDKDMQRFELKINTTEPIAEETFHYTIIGYCDGGDFKAKPPGDFTDRLDTGITITPDQAIVFYILGKGSNVGGTTITVTDDSLNSYTINISETGVIRSSL